MNSSVGRCAHTIRRTRGNFPSGRWYASAIKGIGEDAVQHAFEGTVASQIGAFKRLDRLPKEGLDVAIYMHFMPRYD